VFITQLPPPNLCVEDSAFRAAVNLRSWLKRQVRQLEPVTLVALARANFPEEGGDEAVAKFRQVLEDAFQGFDAHSKEFMRAYKAEKERLAPLVSAVNRRLLAVLEEIRSVDFSLRFLSSEEMVETKKLRDAGMTGDEIARFLDSREKGIEPRRKARAAEREVLVAEQAMLEKFIKSRYDEKYLPPGYEMPPPLHSDDSPGGTA
jgi:hypothetical protein